MVNGYVQVRLFLVVLLTLLCDWSITPRLFAAKPLNVLIIYADDMGFGDLACQNSDAKLSTPHLDRLASQGMRFTDGHSSSGICSPSRFALLTGQYHWRRQHDIVKEMGPSIFRQGDVTIAMLLQQAGYRTGCIGKWHLGWDWNALLKPGAEKTDLKNTPGMAKPYPVSAYDWSQPIPSGPCSVGFDSYFGDGTINFPPYCWIENDRVVKAPTETMTVDYLRTRNLQTGEGNWEFRTGPMVDGWNPYEVLPAIAKKGVEWIHDQNVEHPFFLYFALPSPHAPIIPNDEFVGSTNAGAYGDFVYQTDWVVGQLLQAIEEKKLADTTLVIFTSDNGPEHYAFDRLLKYQHASAGKLRGLKRDVWEGGHRVPFIVRWPGWIKPGTVTEALVSQIDLFATILSAVDVELPKQVAVDSHDLMPLLLGKAPSQPIRESLIHNTYPNKWAIRTGDWLYINASSGEHTKSPEAYNDSRGYIKCRTPGLLFNLKQDVAQRHNLYADQPEMVNRLKQLLAQQRSGARTVLE